MRILIVKLSALGDIIHALPVLDYLRQAAPGAEIDWIVEEQNQAILQGHPLIGNVITVNTRKWRKAPFSVDTRREAGEIVRRLRSASYDMLFDLQGNLKSGIIAGLAGVPKRYGFDRTGVRESLNLLFTNHHIPLGPEDHHISRRSLKIVSSAFDGNYSSYAIASYIHTSIEENEAAAELLLTAPGNIHLLFHTGTTWETKKWSVEGWLELAQQVLERLPGASILFSWGNEQEWGEAQKLVTELGNRAMLLPHLQLKMFCALMKKVDVVVGGDTGPVHLAAAVGTPTVSFYRATDGQRNGPQGPNHITIQSGMPCTMCLQKLCVRDNECRYSIHAVVLLESIISVTTAIHSSS
ncbi:MAG: lipopolysaccharide heptosyltransferase I [Desulfuromonadaceae bacterium]